MACRRPAAGEVGWRRACPRPLRGAGQLPLSGAAQRGRRRRPARLRWGGAARRGVACASHPGARAPEGARRRAASSAPGGRRKGAASRAVCPQPRASPGNAATPASAAGRARPYIRPSIQPHAAKQRRPRSVRARWPAAAWAPARGPPSWRCCWRRPSAGLAARSPEAWRVRPPPGARAPRCAARAAGAAAPCCAPPPPRLPPHTLPSARRGWRTCSLVGPHLLKRSRPPSAALCQARRAPHAPRRRAAAGQDGARRVRPHVPGAEAHGRRLHPAERHRHHRQPGCAAPAAAVEGGAPRHCVRGAAAADRAAAQDGAPMTQCRCRAWRQRGGRAP
jgi:hypothetical protein